MNAEQFLSQLDDAKVVAAIKGAELKTSGEIRVFVAEEKPANVLTEAQRQFQKLGMTATRDRNGVLIYFAPLSREFAVVGDSAVHARCGQSFWEGVTAEMSRHLKDGRCTDAVVMAVQKVGSVLEQHFPRKPDDTDELSDEVVRG